LFKKCPNEIEKQRCNGDWDETINPKAKIQTLFGKVTSEAEDRVISTFDIANEGIKAGIFEKNLNSCFNPFPCPFYKLCAHGDSTGLIKLPEKE